MFKICFAIYKGYHMKINIKTIQRFKQLVNIRSDTVFHTKCTVTLKEWISNIKAMTAIYTHSHAMEHKMTSSWDIKEGFPDQAWKMDKICQERAVGGT